MASIHLIIHGRVQGVGYRSWTVRTAKNLNLTGWARNRRDGTVEAVFCGEQASLDAMLAACTDGPPAAKVTSVERQKWTGDVPADFKQWDTV